MAAHADALENAFTYHAPFGDQAERYTQLRKQGLDLAQLIDAKCPNSAEKDEAIRHVRQAIHWANAAIACNEG